MHGLIGGRWGGNAHGVTDYMHRPGKPDGLSPSELPAKLNQWPTSPRFKSRSRKVGFKFPADTDVEQVRVRPGSLGLSRH